MSTRPEPEHAPAPLLELIGINKRYAEVHANRDLSLELFPGEVHALLGENGAGKSTLTRILYGLSRPDSGVIRVDGEAVRFASPADAMATGIGLVTQEFSLVPTMTVAENVVLSGAPLGRIDLRRARALVSELGDRLDVTLEPDRLVDSLSVGEQQRLEIMKALAHESRVLVLDEPTAVLTPQDVRALFGMLRQLVAEGLSVLLISHKLHEVAEIADRVSILRHGTVLSTAPAGGMRAEQLARLMVGAEPLGGAAVADAGPAVATARTPESPGGHIGQGRAQLTVTTLRCVVDRVVRLDDISLSIFPGEILGIAGVSGNGQTELVRALCGVQPGSSGTIVVGDTELTGFGVAERIAAGFGRLTEDRKGSVVPGLSVEHNLVLEDLHRFRRGPFLDRKRVRSHAQELIARYSIAAAPGDPVRTLSGGNLQKLLLARALDRAPRVFVASQPTRGLDVSSCDFVYERLRELRDAGAGILIVSEDLDELLSLSDRVGVLYAGRLSRILDGTELDREGIGLLMAGQR